MELCVDDRRITISDNFPELITPFPEPKSIVYDHQMAATSLLDIRNALYFPPQKLRPIRSNGMIQPEISESHVNTQSGDSSVGDRGLSVNNMFGVATSELGHVGNQLRELCRESNDCYVSSGGNGFWMSETGLEARSTFDKGKRSGRVSQTETSSSSDCVGNSFKERRSTQKRKRGKKKKLEMFLENMAAKVMQRQEELHNQLIQFIETKEKESMLRERAWKQREIEMAKREEEARAQETSRNLAITSFIQNLLGNQFPCPQPIQTQCLEEGQADATSIQFESHLDVDTNDMQGRHDSLCKRWPKPEAQALIASRTSLEHKFRSMGSKGSLWEEVSIRLASMGYNRTAKKCKEKWENMNKYFRRAMEGGKMHRENGKMCPYFQELETLYKVGPEHPVDTANNEHEDKTQEEFKHA